MSLFLVWLFVLLWFGLFVFVVCFKILVSISREFFFVFDNALDFVWLSILFVFGGCCCMNVVFFENCIFLLSFGVVIVFFVIIVVFSCLLYIFFAWISRSSIVIFTFFCVFAWVMRFFYVLLLELWFGFNNGMVFLICIMFLVFFVLMLLM